MPHVLIFLFGMASVVVLKAAGLGAMVRPVVKRVVKGGIKVGRNVQELASEVTEELQDVAAEASAEVGDDPSPRRRKSKES